MFDSLNIHVSRNVKQFKIIAPMKTKKLFSILLWYCRKRTKNCGTRGFCRTFQKAHRFLEKCIKACHNNQQIKIKIIKANSRIRKFRAKNEDEKKKFGKMSSNFEFLHIKIRLYRIFHENLRKKCL